jgi:glycosyltransferase involved in cell wall biosynthesis
VHLVSPGPAAAVAALVARLMALPILGSYHTELAAYAGVRTGSGKLEMAMAAVLGALYGQCSHVLSPSRSADATLIELGVPAKRIERWDRGVDTMRFNPARREENRFGPPGRINVLYAGRLTKEKGVDLLADSFLEAHAVQPRLHLLLAGGGPEEDMLRRRIGAAATFLGWQHGEALATTFASSDLFLFCSATDTFGQVILEAQASGVPVVAVAAGGPKELIEDGRTGTLVPPEALTIAEVLVKLGASRAARQRLATGGLAAVAERTWERSLHQLARGYHTAIDAISGDGATRRAA